MLSKAPLLLMKIRWSHRSFLSLVITWSWVFNLSNFLTCFLLRPIGMDVVSTEVPVGQMNTDELAQFQGAEHGETTLSHKQISEKPCMPVTQWHPEGFYPRPRWLLCESQVFLFPKGWMLPCQVGFVCLPYHMLLMAKQPATSGMFTAAHNSTWLLSPQAFGFRSQEKMA